MGNYPNSNNVKASVGMMPNIRLKTAMSKAALWRQVYGSNNHDFRSTPVRKGSGDSLTDSDDYLSQSPPMTSTLDQGAVSHMPAKDVNRAVLWRTKYFNGKRGLKNVTRGKVSLK